MSDADDNDSDGSAADGSDGADGSRRKRALSSLRPPVARAGDEQVSAVLFDALARAAREPADELTHGFHSWPARLHPAIARAVLERRGRPGTHVVDPFCGSGTVLVEARVRGLASTGIDLNPVALRVAEVKTDVRPAASIARFSSTLDAVVEQSKERVRARSGEFRAPLTKEQAARFEGHVLRELAGLHAAILDVKLERDRRALLVVLSAIVVKVSKQRSDTDEREGGQRQGRRIGRFIPTEIFHKKGRELAERWSALAAAAPTPPAPLRLELEDARRLPDVLARQRADLVITSPPYAGTYDYARHHALRAPWLGVDLRKLEAGEIGSRRGAQAASDWDKEVLAVLRAVSDACADDGSAVFVVGDGEIARARVDALAQLTRLAPSASLRVLASSSAPRTDWRGAPDRLEHVVALVHA